MNTEYVTKHETEDFALLYTEMQRKYTHKDILENAISENPTGFTEKDAILISNRIAKLENWTFMVGIYMNNENDEFNKITQFRYEFVKRRNTAKNWHCYKSNVVILKKVPNQLRLGFLLWQEKIVGTYHRHPRRTNSTLTSN